MTNTKIINLAGIGLQLLGLLVLTRIDLLALRFNEASNNVRDTVFVEQYEAANRGLKYEPSTQELETASLGEKLQRTGLLFRCGLTLACVGTLLQLISAAVGE